MRCNDISEMCLRDRYRKDLQYNANKYDVPIRLTKSHTKEIRRQGDILLNYDKTFAQKHTVNALRLTRAPRTGLATLLICMQRATSPRISRRIPTVTSRWQTAALA